MLLVMKNAENVKAAMRLGRVYRRQDLEGLTTAVDRDLKTLVESGEVKKFGYGLYYRPKKNVLGDTPPDNRELVRAFLKTDDFLLTSYNHFTSLGLGLTQVYNAAVVYNHKRAGEFRLGGKRFQFRLVPAYPRKLSREYLLVDLLNHLGKLPDDVAAVRKNLKYHINEFDHSKVSECLLRYGNPAAKAILKRIAQERRSEMVVRIVAKGNGRADLQYWLQKSPAERVDAMEFLREQYYAISGHRTLPRLVHVVEVRDRPA